MNELMEWLDGWIDLKMDGKTDRWLNGKINGRNDEWMKRWNVWMDR